MTCLPTRLLVLGAALSFNTGLTAAQSGDPACADIGLFSHLPIPLEDRPRACVAADLNADGLTDFVTANGSLATISVALATSPGRFAVSTYPSLADATSPRVADINGDGLPDVVVLSPVGASLGIHLADASGGFGAPQALPVSSDPRGFVVGDLDADGRADLLLVDAGTEDLVVYRGIGAGAFAPAHSYGLPSFPVGVELADMNGDGSDDVLVRIASANAIGVLLNDGTGGLGEVSLYSCGGGPLGLALADIDGDADIDAMAILSTPAAMAVLLNDGTGVLAPPTLRALSGPPRAIAVGDISRDGYPDVLCATTSVELIPGGRGGLGTPVVTGLVADSIAIDDFDADGAPDLLSVWRFADSAILSRADADGRLTNAGGSLTFVFGACHADLNADGRLDVVTADINEDRLDVLYGNGEGVFLLGPRPKAGDTPVGIAAGDVNADGLVDLVSANFRSSDISVLLRQAGGTYTEDRPVIGTGFVSRAFDFNDDGRLDIASYDDAAFGIWYATPSGGYEIGQGGRSLSQVSSSNWDFVVRDLNADGLPDFAFTGVGNVGVSLATASDRWSTPVSWGVGSGPRSIAIADLDDDGDLDMAVANKQEDTLSVLLADGLGGFPEERRFPAGDGPFRVVIADVTNDGVVDLCCCNLFSEDVSVLPGLGGGQFGASVSYGVGASPSALYAADLNADGVPDLVCANERSDDVSVLLADGVGGLAPEQRVGVGAEPNAIDGADLDDDGDTDIVVSCAGSRSVTVLLGDGAGTLTRGPEADGVNPAHVIIADFDEDEIPDLCVTNTFATAQVLHGFGDGRFTRDTRVPIPAGASGVRVGDPDNDGVDDLVVRGDRLTLLRGHADREPQIVGEIDTGAEPRDIRLCDLDLDGTLDLAVCTEAGVSVLLGNADLTFTPAGLVPGGDPGPGWVTCADADADGVPDLLLARLANSEQVWIVPGDGNGMFGSPIRLDVGSPIRGPVRVGDLNHDGRADLVMPADGLWVMLGAGGGTFDAAVEFAPQGANADLFLNDINADGALDVLSGAAIMLNRCLPPPPCVCDWNTDGVLNDTDFFDFVNDYFAGAGPRGGHDVNDDGAENEQDFFDFINCFFAPTGAC